MKRITKNTDCKFKLKNIAGIYADKFSLALYTTSADTFKTYTEADATDGYINITYDEISLIGKGVINYVCVNHIPDEEFPDQYNDKTLYGTTDYYLDSNITVDPSSSTIDALEKIQKALTTETTERKAQDETLQSEIDKKANTDDVYSKTEVDSKLDNINLTNYYNKEESDAKYATNDALSDVSDAVGDIQNTKADKTDLENYLPLSGGNIDCTSGTDGQLYWAKDGKVSTTRVKRGQVITRGSDTINKKTVFGENVLRPSYAMFRHFTDLEKNTICSQVDINYTETENASIDVFCYDENGNLLTKCYNNSTPNYARQVVRGKSATLDSFYNYVMSCADTTSAEIYLKNNNSNHKDLLYLHSNETVSEIDFQRDDNSILKLGISADTKGISINGYTQDDLLTANYGVKTIGKDIAKQSDLEALQSTVGDIATLLNKINGEEI